jgi:hypothetical protein
LIIAYFESCKSPLSAFSSVGLILHQATASIMP